MAGAKCLTCERPEAEAAVLAGELIPAVAARFQISDNALRRHMRLHVHGGVGVSTARTADERRSALGALYDALAPWPDARQAAADALRAFSEAGR